MLRLATFGLALAGMAEAGPNPIRRVVTLLQEMAKEIEDEVAKEREAYKKFQCYCKKNDGQLDAKQAEAAALIKRTKAEVEAATGQKKQLSAELKKHKDERTQAQKDLKVATKKRAEEKASYDGKTKEVRKTLDDIDKAVTALEKGLGKSFLQTSAASELKQLFTSNSAILDSLEAEDQRTVSAFLQKDYAPQGGEIIGILKQMKDSMDEGLGGVVGEEEAAVAAFNKLKASMQELIKSSGSAIEKKTELKGQVAVKIVEGKNLVSTTEKEMGDAAATAAELKEACNGKDGEFETRQEDAAAEVSAIGQAIEILNGDDSLDLFKKTDTKADAFLQLATKHDGVAKALAELNKKFPNKSVALLAFSARQALKNRSGVDFSKILKMVDDMVALLKQEANDDLASRDQCTSDLNHYEAEQKEVEHSIAGEQAKVEEQSAVIAQKAEQMKKSTDEIAASKIAMQESTEQRKQDNADFIVAIDLNKQAVELITKAKNKLNSYYNPQLVPKEKEAELTREEELEQGARSVLVQTGDKKLPGDVPETWDAGERKNKGQKGSSVLALMDMLANDLNKDTQALEHDEKTAQENYEKLSSDLASQVAEATSTFNQAKESKAAAEDTKQTAESTLSMKEEEHADVVQTLKDLHAQCDFIIGAFEERKAARENEIAGLGKAKAILSGAKFD